MTGKIRQKGYGPSMAVTACICVLLLFVSISVGSVRISLSDMGTILWYTLRGLPVPSSIPEQNVTIFLSVRLPRALAAFFAGGALSLSGAVMQSLLQNPLASGYTLGVSSGASLGAAFVIVTDWSVPALGQFLLPASGFAAGLVTVLVVLAVAARIDRTLRSQTVVLIGMVVSLFVNAMLTLVSSFAGDRAKQLLAWTMGSFNGKRWYHVGVLMAAALFGLVVLLLSAKSLDVMSFGDDEAYAIGVNVRRQKILLLLVATLLTGVCVSFTGTIGFVDLVAPHVVRKLFGASNRRVLPMSFLIGGSFLALSDMVSRTILSPQEIPVGAVTALIGAPFFVVIYLKDRRKE